MNQYKKSVRAMFRVLCFLVLFGLMPVTRFVFAIPYSAGPLDFNTSGQSMWGPGTAFKLDKTVFLGTAWNELATFGAFTGGVSTITFPLPHLHLPSGFECHGLLCLGGHFHDPGAVHIHMVPGPTIDTTTGLGGAAATSGRAGFNFNVKLDSGSVDALVNFNANAILPDPGSFGIGDFINLNPNSALAGGQLDTNLAEISGKVEAVLGARASFNGRGCIIGGCTSLDLSVGFPDQVLELVSFNDVDSPGQIKILDILDPALFQFGREINIPSTIPGGSFGGVTIFVPDVNGTGGVSGNRLTANGSDRFLTLSVDLDGLLLAPLGLPGLGVGLDLGPISLSGDLIDVDLGVDINLVQNFEFTPTLFVDLVFDQAVEVAGVTAPVTALRAPWDALPDFALLSDTTNVTPTFFIDGSLTNNLLIGTDLFFQLDVLKASLGISGLGVSLDLIQLGPLFQLRPTTPLFSTPPLFSKNFALGGFNTVQAPSFRLSTLGNPPVDPPVVGPPHPVPEPGTWALFASGLPLLWWTTRGNRQINRS